jgi:hypothetical protein
MKYDILMLMALFAFGCSDKKGDEDVSDAPDTPEIEAEDVSPDEDADEDAVEDVGEEETLTVNIPEGCNLLTPDPEAQCMFPFPFQQFTRPEGEGVVLDVPDDLLVPHNPPITLDRISGVFDGFSPISQIMYWDPAGFSRDGLPDAEATLDADSPVQLVEWGTGRRIPLFVEPDVVTGPPNQVLIMRPLLRMNPAGRYVVVLKTGLMGDEGSPLAPPPVFEAMRDHAAVENEGSLDLEAWRSRFEEIFEFLDGQGIARSEILCAWDFTTGSDDFLIGEHLAAFRDMVYDRQDEITSAVDTDETDPYADDTDVPEAYRNLIHRKVTGTFTAPSILNDAETVDAPFIMHVPACAYEGTVTGLKVAVYGHGHFGNAFESMAGPAVMNLAEQTCTIQIATNWIGMDSDAREALVNMLFMKHDDPVAAIFYMVDNLLQAHVNFMALAVLVSRAGFWSDLGIDFVDESDPVYLGISNGAIQGVTFMAMTRSVDRAALVVGGSVWTAMLERNQDWLSFKAIMDFPNELEVKKFVALAQIPFDLVDPISFAPYLIRGDDDLGIEAKQVLMQEVLDDASVPNFTSRLQVRTAGVPPMDQLIDEVFGLEEGFDATAGVEGSGYVQYDTHVDVAPPEGNMPLTEDQHSEILGEDGEPVSAHSAVARIPAAISQMDGILNEGLIYQYCTDQICDPD